MRSTALYWSKALVGAVIGTFLGAILLAGCSSAERSRMLPGRRLSDFKITLYSGGQAVGSWTTKGQVQSEGESDGYYFVDRATGKIVEVCGTVVIEQIR